MNFLKPFVFVLFLFGSAGVAYAATAAYMGSGETYMVADARDVVHAEDTGTIVRSSSGECVRTRWMTNKDECSTEMTQTTTTVTEKVRAPQSLSRDERAVYFAFNHAELSPDMRQKLDGLALILTSASNVKGARIVGYADRIGNAKYNEKLSKKRAEGVKNYLIAKGLINTNVAETRWLGSSMPMANCSVHMSHAALINCLQPDRRVEVEIDYTPNTQASR